MFKKLLIVGIVFLTAACVPIAPEPTGPCISDERALLIGETVEAEPSDYLPGYIDIVKVESTLLDDELTVVFHLRDIPEEITFYREGLETGYVEYSWDVMIFDSGHIEPWVDFRDRQSRFKYQLNTAHYAKAGESLVPTSDAISNIADTNVWEFKEKEDKEKSYYTQALWSAELKVSHENNTLTMTGHVPEMSSESLLLVETYDYFHGNDRIHCETTDVSTQQTSVPKGDVATPQPPSPRADLNDLASALAKVDESDSSERHAAILREFTDCFLSGMNAEEREEGLSDDNGNAITPAQITALTLFQAGMFAVMGLYEQPHVVERADNFSSTVTMYELLEGALALCEESK